MSVGYADDIDYLVIFLSYNKLSIQVKEFTMENKEQCFKSKMNVFNFKCFSMFAILILQYFDSQTDNR